VLAEPAVPQPAAAAEPPALAVPQLGAERLASGLAGQELPRAETQRPPTKAPLILP